MLLHAPSHLWAGQPERLDYAMFRTRPFIIGYNPDRCICFDTPFDYRGLPVSQSRSSSATNRTTAKGSSSVVIAFCQAALKRPRCRQRAHVLFVAVADQRALTND